jgi:hypothetical protein
LVHLQAVPVQIRIALNRSARDGARPIASRAAGPGGLPGRSRVLLIRGFEPGENAMAGKKWSDLSPRTRKLLVIGGLVEGALKIAALIDLKRRPASQVRGRKWLWAAVVATVSSAGILPVSYFLFGRRPAGPDPD